MRIPYFDDVLQAIERRKVAVELIIAIQNCAILYDTYFKHEAVSWSKLLFLVGSLLVLFAVVFINYKTARIGSLRNTTPPPDLLRQQARQFAMNRVNELFAQGDSLTKQRPANDANSSAFAEFWNQQVRQWTSNVSEILHQNWSASESQAFLSVAGENPNQFAIGVHPEAVPTWNELNRRIKNLDTLKRDLGRP